MNRIGQIFLIAFILLMIVACKSSSDIAVINLDDEKTLYPPHYDMRQVIVSTAKDGSTFTTMHRRESSLLLKTFDLSCNQVHEVAIELFSDGYCGNSSYALSQNGRYLVYFNDKTKNLDLQDTVSKNKKVLWENIASSFLEIPHLAWISDTSIVIVLRDYPGSFRKTNEINIFDAGSLEKRTIYHPDSPSSYGYSLTSDKSMLAFADNNDLTSIYGVIKVLDLKKYTIRAVIGSGQKIISNPRWSNDGSELAFVEGQELKVWNSITKKRGF